VSRALDGVPPLATTGIGSLPFTDVAAGVRHAMRAYDVPFCPQLPVLDGDMVREWLGSDPRRCGWSTERDRARPAAWDAFLAAVSAESRGVRRTDRIVKLQVTGPLTLAVALERSVGRAGSGRDTRGLAGELALWLAANTSEQVRTLSALGVSALIVIDEPGLAHAGLDPTSPDDVAVWDPLRSTGAAAWGLHVCGAMPWPLVRVAAPDLVSFDVVRYGLDPEARAALDELLAGGARVAWGVLDPVDPGDASVVAARAAACLSALAVARSQEEIAARSLLTPSCGSGRLSAAREHLIAAILQAAAMDTTAALAAARTGAAQAPRSGDGRLVD
jgi:hypothetical protein